MRQGNKPAWTELNGCRMLITDKTTKTKRCEWTLLEISPSGKHGKFFNEIGLCRFWEDLENLVILDVLEKRQHNNNPDKQAWRKNLWTPFQPESKKERKGEI